MTVTVREEFVGGDNELGRPARNIRELSRGETAEQWVVIVMLGRDVCVSIE